MDSLAQSSRTDRSRWISRANPRRKFDETIVAVRFKAAQWEKEERECENTGDREPVTGRYEFSVRERIDDCTQNAHVERRTPMVIRDTLNEIISALQNVDKCLENAIPFRI